MSTGMYCVMAEFVPGDNVLGSLAALSQLESEAAARQDSEVRVAAQTLRHSSQAKKIEHLKARQDELLHRLHDRAELNSKSRGENNKETESENESSELTSALNYLSELKEKLQIYKLAGVSVVKSTQDSKLLCFPTSYRGIYLQSYHVKLQRLASGHFKVVHHDLPPFIVYSCLPSDLEVKDMMSVVRPLQEALSMFVLRQQELKGAQTKFPDNLHMVESSAALDFVCCHLDISSDIQVEITLKYSDLNHYMPSSVNVVPLKQGGGQPKELLPKDMLESLQTAFCNNRLCVAISLATDLLLPYFNNQQVEQQQTTDED